MRLMLNTENDRTGRIHTRSSRLAQCLLTLLIFTMLLFPAPGHAQQTTGDILGTVTDAGGLSIPNATITITNLGTQDVRKVQSSSSGDYVFNLLNPGDYKVVVTAPGFSAISVPKITLLAGDRARVNAPLNVGAASETITVEAVAPALQADNSSISSTVSERAVQELPLNGRNFITLAQTLPGATEGRIGGLNSGSQADDRRQTSSISVNGQGSILNNQEIDGMDNNEKLIGTIGVRPSVESLSELRVQSSNYSADSGRTGGGVINVITKSGTNAFHGSVSSSSSAMTSSTPLPSSSARTCPNRSLRQNQFGAALGGPIFKNRLFFFGDYEGFRIVNATNPTTSIVPTQFEHDNPGNFHRPA